MTYHHSNFTNIIYMTNNEILGMEIKIRQELVNLDFHS
jgi:hypothetical protein